MYAIRSYYGYQWKKTVGPVENREILVNRWNTEFSHRLTPDYYQSFGIANKNLVKEYTELAIILNAREVAHDSSLTLYEKYLDIVALYQSQVNLSMRTSVSVLMQQYSTPAPISFLASSYILKSGSLSGYKAFKNIVKGNTKVV